MDELAKALNLFNRAEPDLLFRDAFGHDKKNLVLGEDFRKRVAAASGIGTIPECAWWAAEYPFNALAGAILLYVEGDKAKCQFRCNTPELVKAGREDVDFIISFGEYLILIEAKAYTPNDKSQVKRKLERLRTLHDFYLSLPGCSEWLIDFRFLLASPDEPQKLDIQWPDWACKGKNPPRMRLAISNPDEFLQTKRCTESGVISQIGQRWRIVSAKRFRADPGE